MVDCDSTLDRDSALDCDSALDPNSALGRDRTRSTCEGEAIAKHPPIVQLQDLSVQIRGELLLDSITIDIPFPSMALIFGPNGAGKSTLLKVLIGEINPSSGTVLVDGQNIANGKRCIGYVPQDLGALSKFAITVESAVAMGRYRRGHNLYGHESRSERSGRIEQALEEVGLPETRKKLLGELSFGQLQRVILARALVAEPKLLLLDEASSALDQGAREGIFDLLAKLKRRMTVVLVTHDMGAISNDVDLVMCLNKRLVSHGRPEQALTEEALQCMYGGNSQFFSHCHVDCHGHSIADNPALGLTRISAHEHAPQVSRENASRGTGRKT